MTMTKTQQVAHTELLAWCAGILEGEGCIYVCRTNPKDRPNPRFRVNIAVTNSDVLLLKPFEEIWGGRLRPRKGTALSRVPIFEWRLEALKAEKVIGDLLPYLRGAKRAKAIAALSLRDRQKLDTRSRTGKGAFNPISEEELSCRLKLVKTIGA